MKPQELTSQTKEELQDLLSEKRAKLCKARFGVRSKQTKNHRICRLLKRDIARILTILKEKELNNN
jgi:large subunit ribosomal protein L29